MQHTPITKSDISKDLQAREKSNLYKLFDSQNLIAERACRNITFSQPIISLNGVGIIYPNTINVIQGQKGVHKSRLTEVFATLFLKSDTNKKLLNMQVAPLKRFHVVYVDTERNLNDQFPYAIQKIKLKSGFAINEIPPNLTAVSLIDIERQERYQTLDLYFDEVRKNVSDGVHMIIILDVVTDCISSFNHVEDSMKLVDKINRMINQYDMSFICIIHENPSNFAESKARGHLGTEIINKASQVMQIGFEKGANGIRTDLISVKFLHSRNTARIEPLYLRYSEEERGLILPDNEFIKMQQSLKVEKASIPELKDWLQENIIGRISKSELIEKLKSEFDCKERTIEDRLKEMVSDKFLDKIKIGKEIFFELKPPF